MNILEHGMILFFRQIRHHSALNGNHAEDIQIMVIYRVFLVLLHVIIDLHLHSSSHKKKLFNQSISQSVNHSLK